MNLIEGALPFFIIPLIISFFAVPLCKQIGFKLGIYAQENNRTVHHGRIVRIGGMAIYLAFIISMAIFMKADKTINGILLGGFVVFIGGLLDDIYDIKPLHKLLFQIVGAIIALTFGNTLLMNIYLPFGITISNPIITYGISFLWIVGITNAINLIDKHNTYKGYLNNDMAVKNSIVMMNTHSLMKSVFTVLIVKLTMKRSFNPTHHQNLLLIHLELLKHQ